VCFRRTNKYVHADIGANDADTANEVNWNGRVRPSPSKSSFKVVFLGKSGVGKTSITLRFCRETFQDGTEATIGYGTFASIYLRFHSASFLTKVMTINDRQIKFEMWVCTVHCAIPNREGYCRTRTLQVDRYTWYFSLLIRALAPMYYRNADAAVLVYDVTDPVRPFSFSVLKLAGELCCSTFVAPRVAEKCTQLHNHFGR
jgi:GTPase SAR1 family protein